MTQTDIEHAADWQGKPGRLFPELVRVGLIDINDDNSYEIHDFFERAASRKDAIKKRNQRMASRSKEGTVPGQSNDSTPLEERRGEERIREERREAPAPQEQQPQGNLLADHQSAQIDPGSVAKVWEAYSQARSKTPKPAPLMIGGMDRTHIQRLLVWSGGDEAEACDVVRAWVTMDNANKTWSGNGWPLAWLTDPNNSATFERARTKAVELRAEREKRAARQAEIAKLNAS